MERKTKTNEVRGAIHVLGTTTVGYLTAQAALHLDLGEVVSSAFASAPGVRVFNPAKADISSVTMHLICQTLLSPFLVTTYAKSSGWRKAKQEDISPFRGLASGLCAMALIWLMYIPHTQGFADTPTRFAVIDQIFRDSKFAYGVFINLINLGVISLAFIASESVLRLAQKD